MTLSFFRRHRKWFMVLMVLAVISMVFFQAWSYMGPVLSRWWHGSATGQVVGSINGKSIREGQVVEFFQDITLAGRASQWWAMILQSRIKDPRDRARLYHYTVGATIWPLVQQSLSGERPSLKSVMTWMALYEEARASGFDTSEAEVAARLKGLDELGLPTLAVDRLVAENAGGRRERLVQALRTDMTLASYIEWLYETLGAAVTPELRQEFIKTDDRIQVRLAVLKADDFLADVKDIPEAQLQQQFEKYKQYLAGRGPDGYGYRIPDRVRVEYLEADPRGFEAEAEKKLTDDDIQKYYDSHKDPDFLVKEQAPEKAAPPGETPAAPAQGAPPEKPPAGPKAEPGENGPTASPPAPSAPAASPAPAELQPAAPLVLPGGPGPAAGPAAGPQAVPQAEAKPPEKKFRPLSEVRDEIRKTLVRKEAARMAHELISQDVGEIRQMKKPPDLRIWADGKRVRYVAVPDFLTADQLEALPGIGKAMRGEATLGAEALALSQLVGPEKARLGLMEISEPFIGPDGDAYALRDAAFQANHEPASLAEVKDQVAGDLRRAKAFDIAREKARKLLDEATAKNLEEAAKAAGAKTALSDWVPQQRVFPIPSTGQILTMPSLLPEVGTNRVVLSECFRMAAEKKRLSLVTLADEKQVVVVELEGRKPPREALFEQDRPMLAAQVARQLGGEALRKAIDPLSIERRMAVVVTASEEFHMPRGARGFDGSDGSDDGF